MYLFAETSVDKVMYKILIATYYHIPNKNPAYSTGTSYVGM